MLGQLGNLVSIWRYPVKAMAGESLFAVHVTQEGIIGDRIYAVVDRSNGMVFGHRTHRAVGGSAQVDPRMLQATGALAEVQVTFAGTPSLDLIPPVRLAFGKGVGTNSNDQLVHKLLSDWLERNVELVRVRGAVAGPYFDGDPICLVTTASLERLRALHPSELSDPLQQRPSLLVRTSGRSQAFLEEEWIGRTLLIGGQLHLHITSARRDPASRTNRDIGVYATVLEEGTISSGDPVMLVG